eukprot:6067942-Pleurochrysis_carterae.AAC.3
MQKRELASIPRRGHASTRAHRKELKRCEVCTWSAGHSGVVTTPERALTCAWNCAFLFSEINAKVAHTKAANQQIAKENETLKEYIDSLMQRVLSMGGLITADTQSGRSMFASRPSRKSCGLPSKTQASASSAHATPIKAPAPARMAASASPSCVPAPLSFNLGAGALVPLNLSAGAASPTS